VEQGGKNKTFRFKNDKVFILGGPLHRPASLRQGAIQSVNEFVSDQTAGYDPT